jgi:hypothetical protein
MLRILAKVWARLAYRWQNETQAHTAELNAGLSTRLAGQKHTLAAQLNKEADDIEKRIAEVSALEDAGYWLCVNGHERRLCSCALFGQVAIVHVTGCPLEPVNGVVKCAEKNCDKPMKLIKRELMSGQEKYESDKERGEAEKIVANKRQQAKAEEDNAAGSEKTAKYFLDQATNSRAVADKIKKL